jgi:hypothetical protein
MTDEEIVEMKEALLKFAESLANALNIRAMGCVAGSVLSSAKDAADTLAISLRDLT